MSPRCLLLCFVPCYVVFILFLVLLLFCSGLREKKYDDACDELLFELSGYLGGIFDKVRTWLEAADTPAEAEFDDWWLEWVRIENAGYKEAEDEEEACEAEEYPEVIQIRNEEKWRRRNLLETEYDLLQQ